MASRDSREERASAPTLSGTAENARQPFPHLGAALEGLGNHLQRLGGQLQQMQCNSVRHLVALQQQLVQPHRHRRQLMSSAASISLQHAPSADSTRTPSSSGAQPVAELGFNPLQVQARLAGVPVYTVANKKKEFVLVAGEDNKQLGLFFFAEKDAEALVSKMKEQDTKLAGAAEVLQVPLDRVYEYTMTPRDVSGAEGVHFRLMPDMQQVVNAVKVYEEAGSPVAGFPGVPLFQAEGLSVKGDAKRYTPLFFSKDDLDVAVGTTMKQRDAALESVQHEKVQAAVAQLQAAERELSSASRADKAEATSRRDAAASQLAKAKKRLQDLAAGPSVEVGSLEEVLASMENDRKGLWTDVMFIPPGALAAGTAAAVPVGAKDKKKKK